MQDDEQQILTLFEDGDRALIAADVPELERIFAEDYIQYDESGKALTKRDVIEDLSSGKVRYISMTSTSRHIRILRDDVAMSTAPKKTELKKTASASPYVTSIWMWSLSERGPGRS